MKQLSDISFWQKLKSYFVPVSIYKGGSRHSPVLEVCLQNGRPVLDSRTVNYSFGNLQMVFDQAFLFSKVYEKQPQTALILGLGAGSVAELIQANVPDCNITGVELDPEVLRLAYQFFELKRYKNLKVINQDAAIFLRSNPQQFDLIAMDIFMDAEIPAIFETPEMLQLMQNALAPGGILVYNRLQSHPDQPFDTHFQQWFPGFVHYESLVNRFRIGRKSE